MITNTRDASNDVFSVSDKTVMPKFDLTKVNPQTGPFLRRRRRARGYAGGSYR